MKKKIIHVILFLLVFLLAAGTKGLSIIGISGSGVYNLQGNSSEITLNKDEVKKEIIDVKYIKRDGNIDTRKVILFKPANAKGDIPLVFVPHYSIDENGSDYKTYIKKGWATASAYEFNNNYNGVLVTDDLVFNNAALFTLRNTAGIDKNRIAIVGGSAGGYMTMMLSELQMGTTASIANSPIMNIYHNLHKHFMTVDDLNRHSGLFDFKVPVQGMISKLFRPINDVFDGDNDPLWAAVSPIGQAKAISNPTVINHSTGDILVPINQLTKNYSYDDNDGTLPKGLNGYLQEDYPGISNKSFEELANPEEFSIQKYKFEHKHVTGELPYSDKLITVNVIDDGPISAKSSHMAPGSTGVYDAIPYLEKMFDKGLQGTEKLVSEKLLLLLDRYEGNSLQLPAHKNVDDSAYGSLAIYQREIVQELSAYVKNHSLEELDSAVNKAIEASTDNSMKNAYNTAWNEIKNNLTM